MRFLKKKAKKDQNAKQMKDVEKFISCLEEKMSKPDWKIDWLQFTDDAYQLFYQISNEYPQIQRVIKYKATDSPEDYKYIWFDIYGKKHKWNYEEMKLHRDSFIANNCWEKYRIAYEQSKDEFDNEELDLEKIGPYGGGRIWPYEYCAYLSMAYFEKRWYKHLVIVLKNWLNSKKS